MSICATEMSLDHDVIEPKKNILDELTGVIVDRTVTALGHNFHHEFSEYWASENTGHEATMTIFERPSARWGSWIWIEYRYEKIANIFISPGKKNTKDSIKEVASQVKQNLIKKKISEKYQDTFDLYTNELE